MTETDERPSEGRPHQSHEGPRVSAEEMRDLGRLRRSRTDRYLGGVAAGIARHFDIDPTVVRVLFVVTSFFGGAGVLAYAALWLLVPEEGKEYGGIHVRGDLRRNVILVVAAVAVLVLLGNAWGGGWGFWHFSWLLVVIGLAALLLANRDQRSRSEVTTNAPSSTVTAPPPPPYDEASAGADTAPLPWQPPVPPPPAPRPRRSGILWFWPTLALVAIGLGTLAAVDAGQRLPAGSYAALALAIIGAVLVLGAFVGRAGGLIALGILTSIALALSTGAGQIGLDSHARDLTRVPITAAAVQPSYNVGTGRILLDLSQVSDPASLNGRTVDVSSHVGDIEVTVPRDMDVVVNADISYVGGIHVDGESRTGSSPSLHTVIDGGAHVPQLTLDLHERVGQIKVVSEGAFQ